MAGRCLSETVRMLALRQYCPVWLFSLHPVVLKESREGVSYVAIVAENSKKSKWNVACVVGWLKGQTEQRLERAWSEASGGSGRNTTLIPLVNSKSETTDRRRRGASAVSECRLGSKRFTRECQGGDFWTVAGSQS